MALYKQLRGIKVGHQGQMGILTLIESIYLFFIAAKFVRTSLTLSVQC